MTDLTTNRRLDLLERAVRDHSKTLTTLHERQQAQESDMAAINSWRQQRDVAQAREEEREIQLRKDLAKIQGGISRISWAGLLAVVGAVAAFIVHGGLNIPGI